MILTCVIGGHTQRRTPHTHPLPTPPPSSRKEFSSTCNWRNYQNWSKTSYVNYMTYLTCMNQAEISTGQFDSLQLYLRFANVTLPLRNEILVVMIVKNIVLWKVTPRCLAQIYGRFGGTLLRWISTRLLAVTSEETALLNPPTDCLLYRVTLEGHLKSQFYLVSKLCNFTGTCRDCNTHWKYLPLTFTAATLCSYSQLPKHLILNKNRITTKLKSLGSYYIRIQISLFL